MFCFELSLQFLLKSLSFEYFEIFDNLELLYTCGSKVFNQKESHKYLIENKSGIQKMVTTRIKNKHYMESIRYIYVIIKCNEVELFI